MRGAVEPNAVERFVIGYRDATSGQPCDPNPKQALAHASEADELLYGGAAFGGKSEWIIWEAIAICLQCPGCDVAVFRRTKPELEMDLVERFLRYVPRHIAKYNGQKQTARFYNGSRLLFCSCHTERDKYRYQSAQWTGLLIDQADHFTESIALYLFSRVRTSIEGVHPKIRLSANPGGIGHAWLKARYIAPPPEVIGDRPLPAIGEVWTPPPNDRFVDDRPLSRQFIRALMTDNVKGMRADPQYVQRIRANPNETTRRMLEEGDWDAFEGQMFGMWRASKLVTSTDLALLDAGLAPGTMIPWHVVPDAHWKPPAQATIFGSVDYGYGNPWSAHFHAGTADSHYVTFKEFYATKVRDVEQARRMKDYLEEQWAIQAQERRPRWKVEYIVMDTSMWGSRAEHGLAKSRAEVYEDVLGIPCKLNLIPSPSGPNTRKAGLQRVLDALEPAPDGFPNWQATAACPNLIRTLPQLIADEQDPDDILHGVGAKKQEDHAYDDCRYFLSTRPSFPKSEVGRGDRNDLAAAFGTGIVTARPKARILNAAAFGRQG